MDIKTNDYLTCAIITIMAAVNIFLIRSVPYGVVAAAACIYMWICVYNRAQNNRADHNFWETASYTNLFVGVLLVIYTAGKYLPSKDAFDFFKEILLHWESGYPMWLILSVLAIFIPEIIPLFNQNAVTRLIRVIVTSACEIFVAKMFVEIRLEEASYVGPISIYIFDTIVAAVVLLAAESIHRVLQQKYCRSMLRIYPVFLLCFIADEVFTGGAFFYNWFVKGHFPQAPAWWVVVGLLLIAMLNVGVPLTSWKRVTMSMTILILLGGFFEEKYFHIPYHFAALWLSIIVMDCIVKYLISKRIIGSKDYDVIVTFVLMMVFPIMASKAAAYRYDRFLVVMLLVLVGFWLSTKWKMSLQSSANIFMVGLAFLIPYGAAYSIYRGKGTAFLMISGAIILFILVLGTGTNVLYKNIVSNTGITKAKKYAMWIAAFFVLFSVSSMICATDQAFYFQRMKGVEVTSLGTGLQGTFAGTEEDVEKIVLEWSDGTVEEYSVQEAAALQKTLPRNVSSVRIEICLKDGGKYTNHQYFLNQKKIPQEESSAESQAETGEAVQTEAAQ